MIRVGVNNMKKVFANLNFTLLLLMIIYSAFGLLMIFSASSVAAVLRYDVSTNHFFIRQFIWLLLAYAVGIVIVHIPTKYYRFVSKIAMFAILFLLLFLFVAGKIAGGAQSWYELGFLNFQPTEFAKIVLIVYLSVYYHRIASKKKISFWNMLSPLLLAGVIFVLIALQPDFGGAFIIFLITIMIFCSLPIAKRHKRTIYKLSFSFFAVFALSLLFLGKSVLQSYQVSRILNFTEPCQRYSDDTGYQVCNGYIAIHNGGLTGVGLGIRYQ